MAKNNFSPFVIKAKGENIMIGKINSTPFKGKIWINAGDNLRKSGGKAHIFNIEERGFDTENIRDIEQHEKNGYTSIRVGGNREEWGIKPDSTYYVPTGVTSTSDILSAYTAAKDNHFINILLEDKSAK